MNSVNRLPFYPVFLSLMSLNSKDISVLHTFLFSHQLKNWLMNFVQPKILYEYSLIDIYFQNLKAMNISVFVCLHTLRLTFWHKLSLQPILDDEIQLENNSKLCIFLKLDAYFFEYKLNHLRVFNKISPCHRSCHMYKDMQH